MKVSYRLDLSKKFIKAHTNKKMRKARLVNTSVKTAVRTGFKTGQVNQC
jgi:hypothetical protein